MPELPEVEQAVNLIRATALNRVISSVYTTEDPLVFEGIAHHEFAAEVEGRRVLDAKRYGKQFYIELHGKGRMPVLHFGMSGFLQVKGIPPLQYINNSKASGKWPPQFTKFIIRFIATEGQSESELAFCDPRRFGRIRLRASPLTEPPISSLGFDPLLCMPALDVYSLAVERRKCAVKVLLLDQSFNAGIGNWLADEILYHSGIHPERRCHTLTTDEVIKLRANTGYVCQTAVDVDADPSRFPSHWLFNRRWDKRKQESQPITLASGKLGTVNWVTVGGRTSAFVKEVQIMPSES